MIFNINMNALWKLLKTYLKKYFSLCYGIVKTAVIDFVEKQESKNLWL